MKVITAALVFLSIAPIARAQDRAPWTGADTALEASFAALMLADWAQTRQIARNPGAGVRYVPGVGWRDYPGVHEINPILGREPSATAVNAYFAGLTAAHAVAARWIPRPWRTAWQVVPMAIEAGVVGHNLGAGFAFRF